MSSRKNPPRRAAGNSQISVSLPTWLLTEVDALAKSENRSRSNFIVCELEKVVTKENLRKKFQADAAIDASAGRSSTASTRAANRLRYLEGEEAIDAAQRDIGLVSDQPAKSSKKSSR